MTSDRHLRQMGDPRLLQVDDLRVDFRDRRRTTHAVDGVSMTLDAGRTLGIVGESGSGKTTLARALIGLSPIASGTVRFHGQDITHATRRERRTLASRLQYVFQDPTSSLNPTRTVYDALREPLTAAGRADDGLVARTLALVGLPADAAQRYPYAFSGGQRQRIAIARALITEPDLVICDEPVSGLDLSVQAQIVNLLRDLQRDRSTGYVFIAHNLDVVRFLSHRTAVMHAGRVVEDGPADVVADHPRHPYTRMLVAATPLPDPALQRERREKNAAQGAALPLVARASGGCAFAPRCRHAVDVCWSERPAPVPVGESHLVACHRADDPATRSA
ncbi:ABC transporter ATP-binding protein [Streptomyces sp. NBC_00988]|uniref:oligopeptide/dipeptide ABC transporter ATP-binding protein n=1 Tax=Streptomyces sp. NBC_00988 TaxID=2903704 RepID=UPI0038668243|nr:ABC transporter ATP-binding protein [Streptomyces sp. NBC_00988]